MRELIQRLVIVSGLVACGSKSAPPPTGVVANQATAVTVDAAVEGDPACMRECLDRDARLKPYCDETCAPVTEPNEACARHCRESLGDEISAEQAELCESECATVPTISTEAMQLCVDICVLPDDSGNAGSEMQCQESCDPDPYDDCTYIPCD